MKKFYNPSPERGRGFSICSDCRQKILDKRRVICYHAIGWENLTRACTGFDRPAESGEAIRGL